MTSKNSAIAVIGAGLIGKRHAQAIEGAAGVTLCCIVDPSPAAVEVARFHRVPLFGSVEQLMASETGPQVDGAILATPNQLHVQTALECIAAGLPTLIEKPLADSVAGAREIIAAGGAANVTLATGHHRRHNPLIARAKAAIAAGELGDVVAVQSSTWLCKHDSYYDIAWHRELGGGPLDINLIHDIDLLRHLCGEIIAVSAQLSNRIRANAPEDTGVVLIRFENGALGTMSLSDTIVSPWSWELTARENPAYPATNESCYLIGGTQGSLSLPNLSVWSNPAERSWWAPLSETKLPYGLEDPLIAQARQFGAVVRGEEAPLVPATEGLRNQLVIEAIKRAANSGALETV